MSINTVVLTGTTGLVLVEAPLIARGRSYLAGLESRREAGGILLGCYRGDHLDVVGMTCPLPGDVRTPVAFDRRDPGHARTATAEWEASGNTIGYVGEWHTHAGAAANPSAIDLRTWRKLLARSSGRRHVFLIFAHGTVSAHEGIDRRIQRMAWPSSPDDPLVP